MLSPYKSFVLSADYSALENILSSRYDDRLINEAVFHVDASAEYLLGVAVIVVAIMVDHAFGSGIDYGCFAQPTGSPGACVDVPADHQGRLLVLDRLFYSLTA